jgi:uncharacterized damage-inducible protein DinB
VNEIEEQVLDAWRMNQSVNDYFIRAVSLDGWAASAPKGKGVAGQFAHLHNVRLMWIKVATLHLMEGLDKIEKEASPEETMLALNASAAAMEVVLREGLASGRVKGFKPHAIGFLAYLLAHEAHHRGQAELVLRQAGHPIDDKASYGLWEWNSRRQGPA